MAKPWRLLPEPVEGRAGPRIRLFLTGRVGLAVDEVLAFDERDLRGRQSRVAFAYLAAHHGRPVPHEDLAEVLWPGDMAPAWENALYAMISRLRSLLAVKAPAVAISRTAGQYQLQVPADTWVDVAAAALALDAAEGTLRMGDPRSAFGPACVAESICRRAFLAGHNCPWADTQREKLERQLLRSLECLARIWLATDEPALAVEAASEAVGLDPYRESSYQLLMQAHEATGNRPDALRVYQRLDRLLAAELGSGPAPETQLLYSRLRA